MRLDAAGTQETGVAVAMFAEKESEWGGRRRRRRRRREGEDEIEKSGDCLSLGTIEGTDKQQRSTGFCAPKYVCESINLAL